MRRWFKARERGQPKRWYDAGEGLNDSQAAGVSTMATVRISSNWGHPNKIAWCGAPAINEGNHIERSLRIPKAAYQRIEAAIGQGYLEGSV
jgi:hypothetical protein